MRGRDGETLKDAERTRSNLREEGGESYGSFAEEEEEEKSKKQN